MGGLVEAIRERVSLRAVLAVASLWVLSTVVFDAQATQFAATLAGSAISGVANLLADAYDLRRGVRTAGLGLATLFGAALLAGLGESVGVPAVLAVAGVWLALDGVQSLRHAGLDAPPERPPTGKEVYRQYLARRIRRLLREQPRSRSELREAMDAQDEAVDAVLADLRERDLVAIEAGVYRATAPSKPGRLARIRSTIAKSARRLARPVAVEFRSDAAYGDGTDDSGGDYHDAGGRGGSNSGSGDEWETRENDRGRSERTDPERAE
jgi:hypothetical protein